MPLSAETQKYLDQLKALNVPPKHTLPIAQVRKAAIDRASLITTKTPIASVTERVLDGPDGELRVRIYAPQANTPVPLIVYFHGGGWATNNLDTHDELCRKLSREASSVVIAPDYRLAPEAKFPAGLEDCAFVTTWASDYAAEWNADSQRLLVAGDSSGANFAAVLAQQFRQNSGPRIAGQILYYPVTDYYEPGAESYRTFREGYGLLSADMAWFWDLYLPDKSAADNPRASPLRAKSLDGLPPALVITAEFDPLVDEGHAYAVRLQEAGVPTTYFCYEGAIHGFLIVPDLANHADRAIQDTKQWLHQLFPTT